MYNQISSNKRKTATLMVIFIAVVLFLGWTFSRLTEMGYAGLIFAAIISVLMSLASYFQGDKIALWAAGAKGPIAKNDNPYLYRLVENLTITAGLPLPKIYVIADPAINAFACGRNPAHASIAVTAGAIEKLKNEELEGVIAHELSHVKNYDILLMTAVVILVGLLALLSDWFIRVRFWGGRDRDSKSNGQIQAILLLIGVVLLILSPIIGELIKLAISRKREFLADASGALLTRYPEGLARALEKIAEQNQPLRRANNATAHLYIANPFGGAKHLFSSLFATHPPIEERIKALRQMA
ncbi:MAG: zinc metalloprotease HtpX [Candidatus Buchananbacteria bacterium RIFCSPHIGHO2_01_FULL_39_14]|uniref:Protease HtpX homolog n=2 Tax=Candidatus Buchananiibacteriota TaxID=1817903 RepID=A0A1G1YW14_9BACT|nr:MAG: zinc metalloprotease HtpX [Candidatus Buchananbacteria bacterium RIFCSPHIGHO2_01_FULL_39_14]OGY48361.1 MAG: zinc metalloprotease HtpX [Candidatus Buchananbacteria bacterium RIFCSPHIGHO2_02_FULL_39_17]OGY55956.1 MAG: zinc metalloprotease HtpX [Candidatus Buchananbacteria bacterium RIFCSPLOWO2_01_FULL_40_23b]